jgi:hypothetical protein
MCLAGTREAVRSRHDGAAEASPPTTLSRRALLGAGMGAAVVAALPVSAAAAR